jgi:hypothetical protein
MAMSRDLRLFYAYRIISRLYFHLPVLFVFFVQQRFTLLQVEVLLAVYGLVVSLCAQIGPRLARRLPRKGIIAFGELLKVAGLALVVTASSVWMAGIGQALNGFGYSLTAGTDSSVLRALVDSPEANARAQSNTQSYMFLAVLVSGVAGAVIFARDASWVFYASMATALLAAVIVAFLPEPASATAAPPGGSGPSSGGPGEPPRSEQVTGRAWWFGYYVTLRAITLAVFVGFLPYLFFEVLHVRLAYFGAVLGIFSLSAFLSARYAMALTRRLGRTTLTITTLVLSLLAIALFGLVQRLDVALVSMAMLGLSSGGVRPLTMNALGSAGLPPQVLGAVERWYGVANAALLVAGGLLLATSGFRPLMLALAGLYVVILLALLRRPAPEPTVVDEGNATRPAAGVGGRLSR